MKRFRSRALVSALWFTLGALLRLCGLVALAVILAALYLV